MSHAARATHVACAWIIATLAPLATAAGQSPTVSVAGPSPTVSVAGPSPTVSVTMDGCDPAPALETWLPILAAELTDTGVEVRAHDETGATTTVRVTLQCEGGISAELLALDTATAKETRRTIVLDDVPDRLRGRTLALAVDELLRATWAELALVAPTPDDTPDETSLRAATIARIDAVRSPAEEDDAGVEAEAPIVAPTTPIALALRIGAGARHVERFASGMGGAQVGLSIGGEAPWVATFDIGAEAGVALLPEGTLTLVHAAAAVAFSLVGRFGPIELTAGGFARGGPLFVVPALAPMLAARSLVLGAVVAGGRLGAHTTIGEGWSVALELDVGAPVLAAQVEVGAAPVAGIDGLCLGATLMTLGDL